MVLSRPVRLAMALWIVAGVAVSVRTVVRPDSHTIFPILAGSVEHWWADRPLYCEYKPLDFFRYPPPFPVVFSPFGLLGFAPAGSSGHG